MPGASSPTRSLSRKSGRSPTRRFPPEATSSSGATREPAEGPAHTNFELDKNGDWIGLYGPIPSGNRPIDSKGFGNQIKDVSFGRFADGNWDWMFMGTPSPRAANLGQGNLPPTITNVNHFPQSPGINTPVTVTARIVDDGSIASAKVLYKPASTFLEAAMRDDGQGGDQNGGDHLWTAVLPGQPQPVVIPYYILARDNQGREATDPIDAPLDTHVYSVGFVAPPLKINEILALNTNVIQDPADGDWEDFVEIYNAGSEPVQLLGMGLSDEFDNPDEYVFPDHVLGPGEFLLIWCDNESSQGPYHADFALFGWGGPGLSLQRRHDRPRDHRLGVVRAAVPEHLLRAVAGWERHAPLVRRSHAGGAEHRHRSRRTAGKPISSATGSRSRPPEPGSRRPSHDPLRPPDARPGEARDL